MNSICSEKRISLTLTQDETLLFENGISVDIQIRVLMHDGNVLASKIRRVACERCLCEEVME